MPSRKNNSNKFEQTQMKLNYLTAFLLGVSLFFTSMVAIGILPLKASPDIYSIDMVQRVTNSNEQGYRLEIHNKGDRFATNIDVKIIFPFQNTTIYKVYDNGIELTQKDGIEGYEYSTNYSKLRVEETITITVLIENDDFEETSDDIVNPTVYLWCDELGRIDIERVNIKFIF